MMPRHRSCIPPMSQMEQKVLDQPTSVFPSDGTNMLKKDQTYIDCNNPVELSHEEFSNLLNNNKIYELPGHFDANSVAIIIKGVKCSKIVEQRIKDML